MDHSKEQMRDMKVWGFLGNKLQVSTVKKERRKQPAASPEHDYSWTNTALTHSNSKTIFHMLLFLLTSGFKGDPFPLAQCTREKQNFNPLTLTLTFVLGTLQQLSHVNTIWHNLEQIVPNCAHLVHCRGNSKNKTTNQAVDSLRVFWEEYYLYTNGIIVRWI